MNPTATGTICLRVWVGTAPNKHVDATSHGWYTLFYVFPLLFDFYQLTSILSIYQVYSDFETQCRTACNLLNRCITCWKGMHPEENCVLQRWYEHMQWMSDFSFTFTFIFIIWIILRILFIPQHFITFIPSMDSCMHLIQGPFPCNSDYVIRTRPC